MKLAYGVYLIRVLETSDNIKLEIKGHTMVLVKAEDGSYVYEPNEGLRRFNTDLAKGLKMYLVNVYLTYGVHQVRFYRVVETRNYHANPA